MDLRVTNLLLVLLALAEATPERYYHVPKVSKTPYPVKSHGEFYCVCFIFIKIPITNQGGARIENMP